MTELLVALIALLVGSYWLYNSGYGVIEDVMAPVCAFVACIGLVIYALLCWSYFAAEYKAGIINREYGTSYSQEEVFYASGVIDTIRELNRKRIEINGDLITGKDTE